jgi:hypothetical protein
VLGGERAALALRELFLNYVKRDDSLTYSVIFTVEELSLSLRPVVYIEGGDPVRLAESHSVLINQSQVSKFTGRVGHCPRKTRKSFEVAVETARRIGL